ncbi:CysH 3'-phosphoadenosine 5'-phosphosulfate sulfotransferase (PAPS reductase)/FAD synthetase and related enzymes [uncultured Caudovirales phage]|uniref:CysH 3'-phosphoadenosine 5'-phosphosulfate sulfotransferase (PAPS reductase)/FAD synthetase and related enzymes n=1 Tax=uncultured Caudovirales phage TaxID=2100421 RepID=A0A6J5LS67_9CAUD|nr:CysH 3'-phosphoadenosine 5'-phosphosulfate sulfotransferase (PAPS reductase)/FAD synthetase and related enzymes [uncultured Caudovirales phage]
MALVLFLKAGTGLFQELVPVEGYARGGRFVRPHLATRHKAPADPLEQWDLFAPKEAPAPPAPPAAPVTAPLAPPRAIEPGPDLASYDTVLVAFSGGKDSVASLLGLLEAGVPREKIELWHHDIDGHGDTLMDWPVTPAYCRAIADALGMPIYFSWREGGFEREMTRHESRTAPVIWENPDGTRGQAGGVAGKLGTREKFPQVAADLSVRWCSGALKVDVMAAAIRNQDRFTGKRTLVVTGERAQESSNRARYKVVEPHRTTTQSRHVDQYRPVHSWSEAEVWDIMRRHGVVPHPAYQLGYSRLSCRNCIFGGADQWATNRALFPDTFEKVAGYERSFNATIHRSESVEKRADKGEVYAAAKTQPELVKLADSKTWAGPVLVPPDAWQLPAGAFGKTGGPS